MTRANGSRVAAIAGLRSSDAYSPLTGGRGARRGGGRLSGVGGGFGGRFNFWPSDFLAFSDGLGPRASGFFMDNRCSSFPTAGARVVAVSG